MIKFWSIITLIILLSVSCYTNEGNIIKNGSFEIQIAGYISQWTTEAFINNAQAVRFYLTDKEAFEGEKAFGIANIQPNDSKIIQWVDVEPDSLYRLSGWIMAKRVTGAEIGANISILGIKGASKALMDTDEQWVYVEVFGKTGKDQRELAVVARLGFYGNLVTGIAYFDNIVLERVYSAPTRQVLNFDSNGDKYIMLEDIFKEQISSENFILIIFILVFSFAAIASGIIFMYVYIIRPFWKKFGRYFIIHPPEIIETAGADRRKANRKKLKLTIIVRHPTRGGGYNEMIFNSLNLSMGGIFIIVDDLSLFKVGDKIEIEIENKGKRYVMGKARIVRLQMEHDRKGTIVNQGIGVQFITHDETHLKWILSIMGESRQPGKKREQKKHSIEKIQILKKQKESLTSLLSEVPLQEVKPAIETSQTLKATTTPPPQTSGTTFTSKSIQKTTSTPRTTTTSKKKSTPKSTSTSTSRSKKKSTSKSGTHSKKKSPSGKKRPSTSKSGPEKASTSKSGTTPAPKTRIKKKK